MGPCTSDLCSKRGNEVGSVFLASLTGWGAVGALSGEKANTVELGVRNFMRSSKQGNSMKVPVTILMT